MDTSRTDGPLPSADWVTPCAVPRGFVLVAMILTLPEAVLMRFLAIGGRWLTYFVRLSLFIIISGLRTILALTGWGYAGTDDFKNFGFLNKFIEFDGENFDNYPMASTYRPKRKFYWLLHPRFHAQLELNATIPIPRPPQNRPLLDHRP